MCNCIENLEKKAEQTLTDQGFVLADKPKLATVLVIKDLKFTNESTATEMTYSIIKTLKNGTTKTLNQKTKVLHSYCPFCGEKKWGKEMSKFKFGDKVIHSEENADWR